MLRTTPWFRLSRHEDADDGGTGTTPPGEGGTTDSKPELLTQEQVDAIIKQRVNREKAKYADYDDVKNKAAKFDQLQEESKSELEREREARQKAESAAVEAARVAAERLAAAELKAALTGITDNPGDIIEDLNLSRYINADGEVDADAVAKLREKYTALAKPGTPPPPAKPTGDADQGDRGSQTDFKNADKDELKAELAKFGLRTR